MATVLKRVIVALGIIFLLYSFAAQAEGFPTSTTAPKGSAWKHMHASGFTGGYEKGCQLIGLTSAQCSQYIEMHSKGQCQVIDVPNGIVLDRLTFTRNGVHRVQKKVLVELINPPSRKTEVCDLGGGLYAMRFHGCDNHGLVRASAPVPRQTVVIPPPQPVYIPAPMQAEPPQRALHVTCTDRPC